MRKRYGRQYYERNYFNYLIKSQEFPFQQTLFYFSRLDLIKSMFKVNRGEVILDNCCGGNGRMQAYVAENGGKYIGLDISIYALNLARERQDIKYGIDRWGEDRLLKESAKKNIYYCQGDSLSLPFKDNTFDKAISLEAIEHFERDLIYVEEIARVLKPGGEVLFSAPSCNHWFNYWLRKLFPKTYLLKKTGGHFRDYNCEMFINLSSKVGLKYKTHNYIGNGFPYWQIPGAGKVGRFLRRRFPLFNPFRRGLSNLGLISNKPNKYRGLGIIVIATK